MKKQVWEVLNDLKNAKATKEDIEDWMCGNKIHPFMLLVHDNEAELGDGVGLNALELDVGEDLPQSLIELIEQHPVLMSELDIMPFLETEIEVPNKTHEQLSLFEEDK